MKKIAISTIFLVLLAVVIGVVIFFCVPNKSSADQIYIVTDGNISLSVGERKPLSYSTNPSNCVITFEVNGTSVDVETENGQNFVVGLSEGEAEIEIVARHKGQITRSLIEVEVVSNEEEETDTPNDDTDKPEEPSDVPNDETDTPENPEHEDPADDNQNGNSDDEPEQPDTSTDDETNSSENEDNLPIETDIQFDFDYNPKACKFVGDEIYIYDASAFLCVLDVDMEYVSMETYLTNGTDRIETGGGFTISIYGSLGDEYDLVFELTNSLGQTLTKTFHVFVKI